MSCISAACLAISCPSKLNKNTKNHQKSSSISSKFSNSPTQKAAASKKNRKHIFRAHCSSRIPVSIYNHHHLSSSATSFSIDPFHEISKISHSRFMENLVVADLDPATAKLAIGILGPFLSAFGFLFILRIVMSWYPKLPVDKFPYVIAYAPTEPLLVQTRKLIPPLAGVDVTPVVWFGLMSFLNEILVGPQGLLVLLSQQV